MDFEHWWNSAAADDFRAKHEDMDGEQVRCVWDAAVKAERERWAAICRDFASDTEPPHKAHEDTYSDGWLDACHEIMWSGEAPPKAP